MINKNLKPYYEDDLVTLYKGDCLEIMQNLEIKFDSCLTDPPYKYLNHKLESDFCEPEFFHRIKKITNKDALLLFFGRGTSFYRWNYLCELFEFKFLEELIWWKKNSSNPMGKLMRTHETMALYRKGNKQMNKVLIDCLEQNRLLNPQATENDLKRLISSLNNLRTLEDWLEFKKGKYIKNRKVKHGLNGCFLKGKDCGFATYKKINKGKVLSSVVGCNREHYSMKHPTQKPFKLIKWIVELISNKGETIIDPFAGSGVVGKVCKELG